MTRNTRYYYVDDNLVAWLTKEADLQGIPRGRLLQIILEKTLRTSKPEIKKAGDFIPVIVTRDTHTKLRELSEQTGHTIAEFVRQAIQQYKKADCP